MSMILRIMCYYSSIITICLFRWHTPNIDFGDAYSYYSEFEVLEDIGRWYFIINLKKK